MPKLAIYFLFFCVGPTLAVILGTPRLLGGTGHSKVVGDSGSPNKPPLRSIAGTTRSVAKKQEKIRIPSDNPSVLKAYKKLVMSPLINGRFEESSLFPSVISFALAAQLLMEQTDINKSMVDFLISFYTDTMIMVDTLETTTLLLNDRHYDALEIQKKEWEKFRATVTYGVDYLKSVISLNARSRSLTEMLDYATVIRARLINNFRPEGAFVYEVTKRYMGQDGELVVDSARELRNMNLGRAIFFSSRLEQELFPFPMDLHQAEIYTQGVTLGGFADTLLAAPVRDFEIDHLERTLSHIIELFESASVRSDPSSPRFGYFTYLKIFYDNLLREIDDFLALDYVAPADSEAADFWLIYREKLAHFRETLLTKLSVESVFVVEKKRTLQAFKMIKEASSTLSNFSADQVELAERIWEAIQTPTSFLNSGLQSHQLVYTADVLSKAHQLLQSEPVGDSVIRTLAILFETCQAQFDSAKPVSREGDDMTLTPIGLLTDGAQSGFLTQRLLPEVLIQLRHHVGVPNNNKIEKSKSEMLLESVEQMNQYTKINLHATEAGGFEFIDFDKIDSFVIDTLNRNRARFLADHVIIPRQPTVTRVFMIEVIRCSDCNKDKLLMDGIKDAIPK